MQRWNRLFVGTAVFAVCIFSLAIFDACGGGDDSAGPGTNADSGSQSDGTGGGEASGPVSITPTTASVGRGQTQAFTANVAVKWSIQESSGGTVDASGSYTAGNALGVFHVVATSASDASQSATATVNVVQTLDVLAGKIGGGSGNVDGTKNGARFYGPTGIAFDTSGNMYVADQQNQLLRKIDTSGVVTTVAGQSGLPGAADGVGAAAQFNFPRRVAFESGAIFVLDASGLRKIDPTTKAVTTITSATLPSSMTDIIGDHAGHLLVSAGNMFTLDVASGVVTALPLTRGGVNNGFAASYLATDGTSLYSLGKETSAAYGFAKINPATGDYTELIPTCDSGTNAYCEFGGTNGIAVSGHYLVFSSNFDGAVAAFDMNDVSSVIPLSAEFGLAFADGIGVAAKVYLPDGLATDASGNVFLADSGNSAIREINLTTQTMSTPYGAAGFYGSADGAKDVACFTSPTSVAVQDGKAYVADAQNERLVAVDLASGATTTVAKVNPSFDTVTNGPTGHVIVAGQPNNAANAIIDIADGGKTDLPDEDESNGLAFNGSSLYEAWDDSIIVATPYTVVTSTSLAGGFGMAGFLDQTGSLARFDNPAGLAIDNATGTLYVADMNNHAIRAVAITGGATTTPFGTGTVPGHADGVGAAARFLFPQSVVLDGKGNLYVADTANATIRKIDLTSGAVTTVIGVAQKSAVKLGILPAQLSRPTGLAFTSDGDLLIVDSGENSLLVVRH